MNPFFFEQLQNSQYLVSNVLGEWALIDEFDGLVELLDSRVSLFPSDALSSDNFVKAAVNRLSQKYSAALGRPELVMVVPTLRCDHSCQYCQVSRAPLRSECHDLDVDPWEVSRWIDSVSAPAAKVEFQGGEPLLRQDFIREVVDSLDEMSELRRSIVITTALGPDISDEFLNWCSSRQVALSVSFDGSSELHTRYRRSVIFDSFTRLQDQVSAIRSHYPGVSISFVSTLTRDTLKLGPSAYIDNCLEFGIDRIFSRPVMPYGFAMQTRSKLGFTLEEQAIFFSEYLDEIIMRNRNGEYFCDDIFTLYLQKLISPDRSGYVDLSSPAGYALRACVLNYDGYIYGSDEARMLHEATKDPSLRVAHINDASKAIGLEPHSALLGDTFIEATAHCDICAFQQFCGADPMMHLYSQGDPQGYKPESNLCSMTKNICESLITRISVGQLTHREIMKWIS